MDAAVQARSAWGPKADQSVGLPRGSDLRRRGFRSPRPPSGISETAFHHEAARAVPLSTSGLYGAQMKSPNGLTRLTEVGRGATASVVHSRGRSDARFFPIEDQAGRTQASATPVESLARRYR